MNKRIMDCGIQYLKHITYWIITYWIYRELS